MLELILKKMRQVRDSALRALGFLSQNSRESRHKVQPILFSSLMLSDLDRVSDIGLCLALERAQVWLVKPMFYLSLFLLLWRIILASR